MSAAYKIFFLIDRVWIYLRLHIKNTKLPISTNPHSPVIRQIFCLDETCNLVGNATSKLAGKIGKARHVYGHNAESEAINSFKKLSEKEIKRYKAKIETAISKIPKMQQITEEGMYLKYKQSSAERIVGIAYPKQGILLLTHVINDH